jgi:hypothetical protein
MDNIKQILKDVYSIDKSLEAQEEHLIKVIQELLASKPDNKIDEVFVSNLRSKLMDKVELLKGEKKMSRFSFGNFSYVFAGTAVVLLAIIAFVNFLPKQDLAIVKAGDNAFGEITFSSENSLEDGGEKASTPPSQSLGMGGEPSSYSASDVQVGTASTDGVARIIAPDSWVNFNYIYSGEDFSVDEGKITVYKKIVRSSDSLSNLLGGFKLSNIDIKKFSNLKVESLQISEDKDFGYTLYIYPKENALYISQNWEKWPSYYYSGENKSSSEIQLPNGQESVAQLANDQILSIAKKFVSDYNIDVSAFGPGEVIEYVKSMSESATVVYPLQIEGKDVYDQSGYKNGLNVTVDFKTGRVSNASNINAGTFQSSDYNSSLSKEDIIAYAKKGGLQGNYRLDSAQKTVDITLGTPVYGLVQTWKQDGNSSLELYVPSLIFPAENTGDYEYYYRDSIIVPLVGEMMNQDIPVIMMDRGL